MSEPRGKTETVSGTAFGTSSGHRQDIHWSIFVVVISAVIGTAAMLLTPFTVPMPAYWDLALEFSRSFKINGTFHADFYPAMLGFGLHSLGPLGYAYVQFAMYIAFAIACYATLRILRMRAPWAASLAIVLALFPDVAGGIKKIWDVDASCMTFVVIACCIFLVAARGESAIRSICLGAVWGTGIAIRPNYPFLIAPIALAFWFALSKDQNIWRKIAIRLLLVCSVAFITCAMCNYWAHGAFYWPQNGPYNFYQGANRFTEEVIESNLNPESSITLSMESGDFGNVTAAELPARTSAFDAFDPNDSLTQFSPLYMRLGLQYVKSRPFHWVFKLGALKLFTVLRPDTKVHPLFSPIGLCRLILSCALPVWILVLCAQTRKRWTRIHLITAAIIVCYCIPFVLTTGDPRYGISLNLFLWMMTAYHLYKMADDSTSAGGLRLVFHR